MFDFIFFGIPFSVIILFVVSIYQYISAKRQNKASPGTFSDSEIKKRKNFLIVMSIVTVVFIAIVIGLICLLLSAIAFM